MGGFILFLLAIVVFVVVFVLSTGLSILRGILKMFTGNRDYSQTRGENPYSGNEERDANTKNGEKIFQKDEGEYVDFEEYKDEDPRRS
ncbi:MAG: hypothetical protein BGN96_03660 [Bacteroidales bacterium 45-6]|nr:MAG: hypothetical protein BGN96_03660 [Bacteroidales bacterium 45-6]